HVSIAGDSLLVTNYGGGTVAALPIQPDGSLGPATGFAQHEGSGPTARQAGPHPHSALYSSGFVYVPDLGLDRVVIYRLVEGELIPASFAALPPGSGPRHLAAGSGDRLLYLVNELNSTVTVFQRDGETGALEAVQTVSTLPAGYAGINYPADIHLHPSGRFLYVSNREHDSIALFLVEAQSGLLSPAGHFPSGGRWPRSFGIDPTGRFLVAAHQKSDSVVSLAIDQASGALTPTGHSLSIPVPVCVRF
ncbi:MAG TPA: lactonase family protein, partial [Symbiobacteriaceae bacterium]|nr:lactonase family protein [Symbiobacteriaceae bacterium]